MAEVKATAPADPGAVRDAFASVDFKVDGVKVTASDAVYVVEDINDSMRKQAALMSWWGKVWATAEAEQIEADAHYRRWLGARLVELGTGKDALSEWKAKAAVESEETFIRMKKAIAQAARNVRIAQTQFMSAEKNASLLQSLGANAREELAAGRRDTTRARPTSVTAPGADGETETETPVDDGEKPKKVSAEKVEGAKEKMRAAHGSRSKSKSTEE